MTNNETREDVHDFSWDIADRLSYWLNSLGVLSSFGVDSEKLPGLLATIRISVAMSCLEKLLDDKEASDE